MPSTAVVSPNVASEVVRLQRCDHTSKLAAASCSQEGFDLGDAGARRRVRRGQSLAPTWSDVRRVVRRSPAAGHWPTVGRIPCVTARRSACSSALRPTTLAIALLSNKPLRNTHEIAIRSALANWPSDRQRRRSPGEGARRRGRHVLQEEPDSGEGKHRQAQPVADRQRDGVRSEVVAELVRQHAAQLVARQGVDRVRRDDDEVAAAREGVELVDRQHGDHEAPRRQPVRLQHRSPRDVERCSFVPGRSAGTEQRRKDRNLHRAEEQQQRLPRGIRARG